MSEITLLSGSSGTFWSLSNDGAWTKLLLSDASVVRTTHRNSGATVVSAYSDNGSVNSVTVDDVAANLASATSANNTSACYFGFPILEPDGNPVDLGSDQFTLDMFLEIVTNPGDEDNNKAFIGIGVNDGTSSYENGRCGGHINYNNSNGPKIGTFGWSGRTEVNGYDSLGAGSSKRTVKYVRVTTSTSAIGEDSPLQFVVTTGYSGSNERINSRQDNTSTVFSNSLDRPSGSNAYVFITVGKQSTAGSGAKTFTFKAYYKIDMQTFNGAASNRPG